MTLQKEISSIKTVLKSFAAMPMFIDKQHGLSLLMRYNSLVESALLSGSVQNEIDKQANFAQVSFYSASGDIVSGSFKEDFSKIAKGSVAVVSVKGAMMRESYCTMSEGFVAGTKDLEETVRALNLNENVDAVVFSIDSPGGQSYGSESLAREIKKLNKPKLGHFENVMASAAVHAFQGLDELHANESQSSWGSIGTYVSWVDDKKFYESMGLEFMEIYAPQSTEKNIEFREAENGNNEPMEAMLQEMTAAFIKDVKKARPTIQDDGHVYKGKLYSATEAKKIGAIDGINNLQFVVDKARKLSRKSKSNNSKTKSNQIDMSADEKKVSWFDRILGKSTTTEEADEKMGLVEAKVSELTEQLITANATIEASATELATTNQNLIEKVAELEALNTSNESIQSELDTVNATIKEAGFENLADFVADHKTVIAHNIQLGGLSSAATPVDNQQTVLSKASKKDVKYQDVLAEMEAQAKAKKEAKA